MSRTRDNHYVPEWYQKGFIFDPKNGKLCYLDLSPDTISLPNGTTKKLNAFHWKSPSQCFYKTDLYTTFFGSHINDEIERCLFGDIDHLGYRAVKAFIGDNVSDWHDCFRDFFSYIDAQKIRTPKGLQWIQQHYPQLNQLELMLEMQAIRKMHCTLWTEGVREIVSAKNSETKFIVSDHPVTLYNPAYPPDSAMCAYPNDPLIAQKGTQTIFPLDKDYCLILTNYEYAEAPDTEDPTEKRTNARNFRNSMVWTNAFIKSRTLNDEEVIKINYLIKSRARRFVGAAKQEWLYPELKIKPTWNEIGKVLLPQNELWRFGGETYIGYTDGRTHYQDAFGRTQPENKYLKKPKIAEPGRNDPCGCGSPHKYKKCCLNKPLSQRTTWKELSIRERNIILNNGISKILGLSDNRTWEDVRRELSSEQVKKIHELYGSLWPLDTDLSRLLPKPDRSLRALYTGIIDPRTIGNSVTSLVPYFDEILVQIPFWNPWSVKKEYSPIENPYQYKLQTLKNVALFLSLMPFIDAGYINLFPDPCDFDHYLRKQRFDMAQERAQHRPVTNQDKEVIKQLHKDELERTICMIPKDKRKQHIQRALPHLTDEKVEKTLEYIERKQQADPLSLLQDDIFSSGKGGQLLISQMTPNFEMSLYIAQITGSLIVTDSQYRWKEITDAQNRKNGLASYPWIGLTDLIKGKEQMLSADGKDTFELRQSGKFVDLRKSMGNIYNAVTTTAVPDNNTLEMLKYEFENACSARLSKIEENDSSFKASFECLIPEGGIVHNNVQRMLLSSGVDNYTNNVPMAIQIILK